MAREIINELTQADADGTVLLRTVVFTKKNVFVKEWGWSQFAHLQNYVQNVCVYQADQVVIERIEPEGKKTKKGK